MELTNRQQNEIIYWQSQIKWREQELAILEAEFKEKKWQSDTGVLDERGLWDATQKIGKHRDAIKINRDRLIKIISEAL